MEKKLKKQKTEELKIEESKTVELKEPIEILFPDICIICGKRTSSRLEKRIIGEFIENKSYRYNYHFKFPICNACNTRIRINTGISNIFMKILILSTIIGSIVGLILGLLTYSIAMAIAIPTFSFIFPLFFYFRSIKNKLNLNYYFKIDLISGSEDIIRISFRNSQYAEIIRANNLKQ